MPLIQLKDVQLYYEWHGHEGDDVIVFNNGLLMDTNGWVYQRHVISRFYRVLLYDCRGQGQSDHPETGYSMDLHVEDLKQLLESLGVKSAHLAGVSFGGEIAMFFALRHPSMVKSLFISSAVSEFHPQLMRLIDKWIALAKTGDGELFYRGTINDNFSAKWLAEHPNIDEKMIPYYKAMPLKSIIAIAEAAKGFNCTSELYKIAAPMMVVAGQFDQLKPYDPYTLIISRAVKKSKTIIFAEAGHACHIEAAFAWNSALLGFLRLIAR
jgi:3-oxoadipate enol-lactonase